MESTADGVGTLGTGPKESMEIRETEEPRPLSADLTVGTEAGLGEADIGGAERCCGAVGAEAADKSSGRTNIC